MDRTAHNDTISSSGSEVRTDLLPVEDELTCPGSAELRLIYTFRTSSKPDHKDKLIEFANPYQDEPQCGDSQVSSNDNPRPSDAAFEQLRESVNKLLGYRISEFDSRVPDDLGCARAVSLALQDCHGLPIREFNCVALEETLKAYGWTRIPLDRIQPSDVIIGKREPGQHGHAAIYMGNGRVFNNNADELMMQFDDFNKFLETDEDGRPEYREIRVFSKNAVRR